MKTLALVVGLTLIMWGGVLASVPELYLPRSGDPVPGPKDDDLCWSQTYDLNGAGLTSEIISEYDLETEVADDFVIDFESRITLVRWWGMYFGGSPPPEITVFSVRFYEDSDCLPLNTPFAEYLAVVPDTTHIVSGQIIEYEIELPYPLLVAAETTYWLSIQADDHPFPPQWAWRQSTTELNCPAMFRSEYFAYPDWILAEEVVGSPFAPSFELGCRPTHWTVCPDGSGRFLTIQEAINEAMDGDVVELCDDTFTGVGNQEIDYLGKAITVRSQSGDPSACIINGASRRGFNFHLGEGPGSVLEGVTLTNCSESGGGVRCASSSPTINNCIFASNMGPEGAGMFCSSSSPILTNCTFMNNDSGNGAGVHCMSSSSPILTNCTFADNEAGYGGGMYCSSSSPTMTNCTFASNTGSDGGGVYCTSSSPTLTNCVFMGNEGVEGAGIHCRYGSSLTLTGCTFAYNDAYGGGGLYCEESSVGMMNCSFAHNIGIAGAGVACEDGSSANLEKTIVAFSTSGTGIECFGGSSATLSCCDLYGNAGGDWVGTIADQYGAAGNISEDPLFCDAANGNFELAYESPCIEPEEGDCGDFIGAHEGGCGLEITSVEDVGNDQGRQVRVRWNAAACDRVGSDVTISCYSIWRQIEEYALAGGSAEVVEGGAGAERRGLRWPPGEWEFVLELPACGEEQYAAICPTLCDSTAAEGVCWSAFFVRAHAEAPLVFFDSSPERGYSIDNLAPEVPRNLRWNGPVEMAWDEAEDADFDYFTVYGSDYEELDGNAVLIGYTTATNRDLSGDEIGYLHYFVTATDFVGNEGEPASLETPTDVDGGAPPLAYALRPAMPNPLTGTTTLSFDLPEPCAAQLTVYDVAGRQVRTLVDRILPAGRHEVVWDAQGENAREISPGIYFTRLQAGDFRATERLVILK